MSLFSMTGYGQGEALGERYQLSVEIKSVNHRFRDMRFKMSSLFISEEMAARKVLEKSFSRGSFDIYVNYRLGEKSNQETNIDVEKVSNFLKATREIGAKLEVPMQVNADLFLKSDFVKADEHKEAELRVLFNKAFEEAIQGLSEKRESEGSQLKNIFDEYIGNLEKDLSVITTQKAGFKPFLQEKLKKRIIDSEVDIEKMESRLLQEVIFYLEKWDVDEEIVRIEGHLSSLKKLLDSPPQNTAGRKIEFILQELGRETNTIGSKSHNKEISESVVEMKVVLEKMREQAANVQ